MANATTNLLLDNLRAKLAGAADDAITQELFNVCDELAREALRVDAPLDVDGDPASWLPSEQWVPCYQALLNGVLARMYAQFGKPYSSDALAAQHLATYLKYLDLARTESSGAPSTIQQRLMSSLRVQVPGARDAALKLELYNTANKIRAEALRLDPLAGNEAMEDFLPSDLWDDAHLAMLHGTLTGLFSQLGREWSNAELAAAHLALFNSELDMLRTEDAADPATAFARIVSDLRVQVPFARDAALKLEIYATVDKIRREALRLDPLAGTETNPADWLTTDEYGQCYHAIVQGTLSRLYLQVGKPWSNPDLASAALLRYTEELDLIRGEAASSPTSGITRLMDLLRVRLVGARDEILKMELFAAIDEFFRHTNMWKEEIEFSVGPYASVYEIESDETAALVRLLSVTNGDDIPVAGTMEILGQVDIGTPPSANATYTATVALTIIDPVTTDGYPSIPDWLLPKYLDTLLDGTLGRMMSQPAKPYSSERMSIYHLRRWRNALAQGLRDANHKNLYGAQAWAYPRGWR